MRRILFVFILLFPTLGLAQATYTVKGTTTLSATVTDPSGGCGIASVQFMVNGIAVGSPVTTPTLGSVYQSKWDSTTVPNGTYPETAVAKDKAGVTGCDGTAPNTSTMPTPAILIVNNPVIDRTPPVVTMGVPLSGAVINDRNQPIRVNASDESGIGRLEIRINDDLKASVLNKGSLQMLWNTRPYKGENVTITANAIDKAGNKGTTTAKVTVK